MKKKNQKQILKEKKKDMKSAVLYVCENTAHHQLVHEKMERNKTVSNVEN